MTSPSMPSRRRLGLIVGIAALSVLPAACIHPPEAAATPAAMARWAGADSAYAGGCFATSGVGASGAETRLPTDPGATFEAAWSMINERHFDTTFNGVDWAAVRAELLPRAREARTTEELRGYIRDMLGRLGQSHFALIPAERLGTLGDDDAGEAPAVAEPRAVGSNVSAARGVTATADGGPGTVGLEMRVIEGQFVVTRVDTGSAAARAGVRAGWIVRSIGTCLLSEQLARSPVEEGARKAAFRATLLAAGRFDGEAGTTVRVEFIDGGGARLVRRLTRTPVRGERVLFGNLPAFYTRFDHDRFEAEGRRIGVIRFNSWMTVVLPRFDAAMDELRDSDGIIIDLRGNPGGVGALVMGTAGHFLASRVALGTLKTRESELRYIANPRMVGASGSRVQPYAGPLVVLVDGLTGSTSEVFAGGMQAIGRARIIGETSAGAVLPALNQRLPNGDVLYHAFADFVTPLGDRLEGVGVIPDDAIPLDRSALLAGRDSQMDAAVRWIASRRH